MTTHSGTHGGIGGAVLVCGATSGAGKSTVAAGLCRWFARAGASVAPFKAQNMSNHAAVTVDGGEIGRSQAVQASAAGVDPTVDMNPILLKPAIGRDGTPVSHVVVRGDEVDATDPVGWGNRTDDLRPVVLESLHRLRKAHDVVVAEGAGGAAEVNLLDRDLVNLPLARAAGIPAVLVVDIDRGGAFAAAHGTVDLLPPDLRVPLAGIVLNRFRGDPSLLDDGLRILTERTGLPVLGVLPHLGDAPLLGVEDSLDLADGSVPDGHPERSIRPVRVAAIRLPHLANPSDLDPLLREPDVVLTWAVRPDDLHGADLIVLPGSRSTVADLAWLRRTGLADAIGRAAADGSTTVLGLCAGHQMLGRTIQDDVESGAGTVDGLGLLPVETTFMADKVVRLRSGTVDGDPVAGYEIHLGRPTVSDDAAHLVAFADDHGTEAEGCRSEDGRILGTSLHGLLDADDFRARLLSTVAGRRDRRFQPSPTPFAHRLDAQHERLADWIDAHLDTDALVAIAATATDPGEAPGW